jgi:hypothetical protein
MLQLLSWHLEEDQLRIVGLFLGVIITPTAATEGLIIR